MTVNKLCRIPDSLCLYFNHRRLKETRAPMITCWYYAFCSTIRLLARTAAECRVVEHDGTRRTSLSRLRAVTAVSLVDL